MGLGQPRSWVIMLAMDIKENVPLKDHSTMRLGGDAAYLVEVHNRSEVEQAAVWAKERNLPAMMIGIGSNIVWRDEGFKGLVLVNKIMGFTEQSEGEQCFVTIGAGENWDAVVARVVESGLTGIECLSLIPGTAGATPVQNVGAYGQEISDTLVTLEAYDQNAGQFVTLRASDLGFGYRTSRFKTSDHSRFFITAITLRLSRGNPHPPFYAALQNYLDSHEIHEYTPAVLRDAVIDIRQSKLPDPAKVANNGSFFANPIIYADTLAQLEATHGEIPHWPTGEGMVKVPAAWLVQQAGFKDAHDTATGMATWPMQCLVLVNEHAESTAQLLEFKQKIVGTVQQKFGITLEQEPELLP